jgi:hypothetical protein
MQQLLLKQQNILSILIKKGKMPSSAIHAELLKTGEEISLVTVKRMLSEMVNGKTIDVFGSGRTTSYAIAVPGRAFFDIDAKDYCLIEPDRRFGLDRYNFDLFLKIPEDIFDDNELARLNSATETYKQRSKNISAVVQKKEWERLVIELSWKSSKIEGNTYTLLETEKLILENKKAIGRSKDETQMILNHKDALNCVRETAKEFTIINRVNLEKLHSILV